ncbi:MAG: bifunctional (p)ppGpp synthetase/guanosine-3',5'-bis(diphosphate) 3'-pyrophosphohydrolase [Candidatus Nomurabacteria bacterium]|nr:bifunctional (p)ppGpp synthetase/guanosine-3',5'-bis(diphosphate) 3'-pyrophosphohydrolase [Candidatus Nomurabacteria bacterium]USN87937.1 MAG: bifunctional (p)ppGpp synthetase/guanosine-3',5'-bis(diphosphate) 3'-pyrophosphohydrolase [Candidatus Nomurabacteria bacterium]
MYSYRIEQAIRAASVLHKEQLRKGSMPFPYVTHLIAVAFTLLDYTQDEDVIIAALLHDTLEDTDYTIEELQEDFGGRVRDIVEAVTEPKLKGEHKLTWREKKEAYAKQLRHAPHEALLVAAADKIHNFRTMVEDYSDSYERYAQDFGKNFDERLEVYQEIGDIINDRLESPIVEEFNHVFEEFKQFINKTIEAEEHRYDT